jgi:hypothetical protein
VVGFFQHLGQGRGQEDAPDTPAAQSRIDAERTEAFQAMLGVAEHTVLLDRNEQANGSRVADEEVGEDATRFAVPVPGEMATDEVEHRHDIGWDRWADGDAVRLEARRRRGDRGRAAEAGQLGPHALRAIDDREPASRQEVDTGGVGRDVRARVK